MPLYDFKCLEGHIKEVIMTLEVHDEKKPVVCKSFGKEMKQVYTLGANIRIFKAEFYDHIGPQPIFIESKRQLKEECERHGVYSKQVEGGFNRNF